MDDLHSGRADDNVEARRSATPNAKFRCRLTRVGMNASTVIGALSILGTVGAVVLLIFELAGRRVVDRPVRERLLLVVFLALSAFALAIFSRTGSRLPAKRVPDPQKASSKITITGKSIGADIVPTEPPMYRRSESISTIDAATLQLGNPDGLAILIVDSNNEPVGELVIATRQTLEPARKVISPFTERIFEAGAFTDLYHGRGAKYLRNINATRWARDVMIGRVSEAVSRSADYDVVSTRLHLDVRLITAANGEIFAQFNIEGIGVGFNEQTARVQALQRLTHNFSEQVVGLR